MTKSKSRIAFEQQDAEERAFMQRLEADKERSWKCGIYDPGKGQAVRIFASADTEPDAERYMLLRYNRNGGVIPHRLTHEVGWWQDSAA
jgi:hypothetical protein